MNVWLLIALGAYFLYALNGLIDKFLLSKSVRHPVAYAFYIGITGPLTLILLPFGFRWLHGADILIALVGGASFVAALIFFYRGIQQTSISRMLPIEGGLVPIFTLGFAYILLDERLSVTQLSAFLLLVMGAVLISLKKDGHGWHSRAFGNAIIAAVLFALSTVVTKYVFDRTNFVSGLIWTRLGFFIASVSLLLPAVTRRHILSAPKQAAKRKGSLILYYGARVIGSVAGLAQNYAISAGSVVIVNALQGTQYAFLLITTTLLSRYYPKILREQVNAAIIAQKVLAIILISVGLYLLRG